jgi:hypothetical protein
MKAIDCSFNGKVNHFTLGLVDQLERLKLPPDSCSYVLGVMQRAQEPFQLQKFAIVGIVKPRFNRNSVVHLITKRMRGVVDKDGLRQIPS